MAIVVPGHSVPWLFITTILCNLNKTIVSLCHMCNVTSMNSKYSASEIKMG